MNSVRRYRRSRGMNIVAQKERIYLISQKRTLELLRSSVLDATRLVAALGVYKLPSAEIGAVKIDHKS